jgi:NitT/TauT family transport system ATP-binding protein
MLVANKVSHSYSGRAVLHDLNITCPPAKTVAIIGPSGSGKTTMLSILSGFLRPSGGEVTFNGVSPTIAAKRKQIGYVFQQATLIPWLTVFQNVALPALLDSPTRATVPATWRSLSWESRTKVWTMLELARISHAATLYPHELSGGMKARAALARALVTAPSLLLLDEPMNGLDDQVKEELYSEFQSLATAPATVLVTHNLQEAILLADHVCVIKPTADDGASTIVHEQAIPFARPRDPAIVDTAAFSAIRHELRRMLK